MTIFVTQIPGTLKVEVNSDNEPTHRSVVVDVRDITGGVVGTSYRLSKGGIPLTGSVQDYLDGIAADILADGISLGKITPYSEDWILPPVAPTQTTNNTQTEVLSIPIPLLFHGDISLKVSSISVSGGNGARKMWHLNGSVFRGVSGDPVIDGTANEDGSPSGGNNANPSVSPGWGLNATTPAGEGRIAVMFTGANGVTIRTTPDIHIRRFSP